MYLSLVDFQIHLLTFCAITTTSDGPLCSLLLSVVWTFETSSTCEEE